MSKKRPFDVGIIFGDRHEPKVDIPVLEMFVDGVKAIRPDFIIENGDAFNSEAFASFIKDNLESRVLIKEHIQQFRDHTAMIKRAAGKKCHYQLLGGTHEWWMVDYLARHPEINGEANQWYNILGLPKLGVDHLDYKGRKQPIVEVGNLLVTHGTIARKHSAYSAKAMLEIYGRSVLVNHTHRLGAHWQTDLDTTHVAYENGCLCSEEAGDGYMKHQVQNWQQGFSIVMVERKTGWFRVDQIPIVKVPGKLKRRMILHEGVFECGI